MCLIIYGVYSGGSTTQAGAAIYLAVWLQPVILSIAVYCYFYNYASSLYRRIAGWSILVSTLLFIVALLCLITLHHRYLVIPTTGGDVWSCITSTQTTSMFYYWGWLYLVFISFYIVLLLAQSNWRNWYLAVLLLMIWCMALYYKLGYRRLTTAYAFCFIAFYFWLAGVVVLQKP